MATKWRTCVISARFLTSPTWCPSGVSAGQITPHCELCSCRGFGFLPSRPVGQLTRRRWLSVEANVSLFSACNAASRFSACAGLRVSGRPRARRCTNAQVHWCAHRGAPECQQAHARSDAQSCARCMLAPRLSHMSWHELTHVRATTVPALAAQHIQHDTECTNVSKAAAPAQRQA